MDINKIMANQDLNKLIHCAVLTLRKWNKVKTIMMTIVNQKI